MIRLFKPVVDVADVSRALSRVLESGQLAEGPEVLKFEETLGEMMVLPRDRRVLTVNSGTTAITMALKLAGVGPGSEVITTPMTCLATNLPIAHLGAKAVWADIDPETGFVNIESVVASVNRKTAAVLAVDWGGEANISRWNRLTTAVWNRAGEEVPIVRDAAHCLPTPGQGAQFVAYSFQAIKFLTCGDGGALVLSDALVDLARRMRWFGLERGRGPEQRCEMPGYKWHMNDLAAAMGRANRAAATAAMRQAHRNAWTLSTALHSHVGKGRLLAIPRVYEGHQFWLYTIRVQERDRFIEFARRRGVECSQVHTRNDEHPVFRAGRARIGDGGLTHIDTYAATQVSIPVGAHVGQEALAVVANTVIDWAEGADR